MCVLIKNKVCQYHLLTRRAISDRPLAADNNPSLQIEFCYQPVRQDNRQPVCTCRLCKFGNNRLVTSGIGLHAVAATDFLQTMRLLNKAYFPAPWHFDRRILRIAWRIMRQFEPQILKAAVLSWNDQLKETFLKSLLKKVFKKLKIGSSKSKPRRIRLKY